MSSSEILGSRGARRTESNGSRHRFSLVPRWLRTLHVAVPASARYLVCRARSLAALKSMPADLAGKALPCRWRHRMSVRAVDPSRSYSCQWSHGNRIGSYVKRIALGPHVARTAWGPHVTRTMLGSHVTHTVLGSHVTRTNLKSILIPKCQDNSPT